MGPEAEGRPKPLIEIGGRPILWHIMKLYATYGHTHFILPLGHRGELFRRYFVDYETLTHDFTVTLGQPSARRYHHANHEHDWLVTLMDAGQATNKGARVRKAAAHIEAERFFVTYGDGIGDVDLAALLEFHQGHGRLATLTGYQPFSQYGVIEVGEGGRVTQLREKPRQTAWINAGFFVFERAALGYFGGPDRLDLEREVLPQLAADDQLRMYPHSGFWASMDTFKEAQELNELWERGAPWKVWD
jgi:glucose-1-phosphate cytidylyltransferase